MDFNDIVDRLSKLDDGASADKLGQHIRSTASQAAALIRDDKFKIVDLVKGLNAVLTNGSYEIRGRGVELLAQVVKSLPISLLSEKEIELMTEFICLRLIDHKSMERSALECLSHFVDCDNKPARYNKQLMEFIKNKANIRRMDVKIRKRIYEMLKKFVAEKKRQSNTMDGDFIYSLVTILEGENNPDNLMLCFGMISFILKNFDDLDPYIDDIFEWLTSYYPIDYTPSDEKAEKEGEVNIQRLDLVDALYECFYANPLNSENLQTLLLEKFDSNVMSTKLESLECLIKCYENYAFPLASIVKYNSTLWTALRMNCLRKIDTIDSRLLETSLRTLTKLAERLSKDDEMYFTFISDMYEELAIAFRKPEMDLFEPAARLVTHAILPSIIGFNYVLEKLLPICVNALEASELKPLSGLAYMFEQLHQHHPDTQLKADLNDTLSKLVSRVTDLFATRNEDIYRLLDALFSHQVFLSNETLKKITAKLWAEFLVNSSNTLDIEMCLALICVKYNQFSLITRSQVEKCDLDTLIRLIYDFELAQTASVEENLKKFSIYLRILIIRLDKSKCAQLDELDQLILNDGLARLREQLELVSLNHNAEHSATRICEQSAIIHAIILNKLAPNNANQILMKLFSSSYCQRLVTEAQHELVSNKCITLTTYLPHVKWIFKSLVIRNHQLATPLTNLVLNCVTSDKVHPDVAREASLVFSFVLAPPPSVPHNVTTTSYDSISSTTTWSRSRSRSERLFSAQNNYQVFSLYKQKFYMQANKEIRLRYDQQIANAVSSETLAGKSTCALLIFAVASQLTHLPLAVYKRDHVWLIRQILRVLSSTNVSGVGLPDNKGAGESANCAEEQPTSALIQSLYSCLEGLIQADLCDGLVPFLPSLIDLNLKNAQEASSLLVRRQALLCLAKIATTFKESDLIIYKTSVVDKLRVCLADKKRLVRQAAGETRLRWVTLAQPIGSP